VDVITLSIAFMFIALVLTLTQFLIQNKAKRDQAADFYLLLSYFSNAFFAGLCHMRKEPTESASHKHFLICNKSTFSELCPWEEQYFISIKRTKKKWKGVVIKSPDMVGVTCVCFSGYYKNYNSLKINMVPPPLPRTLHPAAPKRPIYHFTTARPPTMGRCSPFSSKRTLRMKSFYDMFAIYLFVCKLCRLCLAFSSVFSFFPSLSHLFSLF